jgi:outer membrane protein assembly complex protein YaeT
LTGRAVAALLTLAALRDGAAARAAESASTTPVTSIQVFTDAPIAEDELRRGVAITLGQPLQGAEVSQTLRRLQTAGWGSDIEVRVLERGGEAGVQIVLRATPRVVAVRLSGPMKLAPSELRRSLAVAPGDFWSAEKVERSVASLVELYHSRGYPQPSVDAERRDANNEREVEVAFRLEAGPPSRITAITFDPPLTGDLASGALKALRLAVGERYSLPAAREASERLEAWLHREGFRLARVDAVRSTVSADRLEVAVVLPVVLGPKVTIEVVGAGRAELGRNPLELGEGEGYDEALVLQLVARLQRRLQTRGFYDAVVTREEESADETIRLRLSVEPGARSTLTGIRFEGNAAIATDQLLPLLSAAPRRLLQPASGRLVDSLLAEDLANVKSYYASQGYGAARIGPPRIEREPGDGRDRLVLVVPVVEGVRTEVASFELVGSEILSAELGADVVHRRLGLEPGGPFHSLLLQNAVDQLAALYDEVGYEGTEISTEVAWPEAHRAAVSVVVREGSPVIVDRVLVRGRAKIRPGIIESIVGFETGDRISTRGLLEAQRRLYGLGVFSRADLQLQKTGELAEEEDLLVTVREAPARRVTYALGYDRDEGWRGQLGWVHSNLFGRAVSWQTDVRLSRDTEQIRTFLQKPFLGPWPIATRFTAFRLEQERPAYFSRQLGTQIQADYLSATRRFGLLFGYRNVAVELADDRPATGGDPIPREEQQAQIASLSPSVFIDRRDDPIDPHRGWSALWQLEQAFPLASAEEEFTKVFAQATWTRPMPRQGVVAVSGRLGAIEPGPDAALPDASLPEGFASREVPISERLFAGGRTTHRAYRLDFLGVRGETLCGVVDTPRDESDLCRSDAPLGRYLPVGGNALALVNLDYRFAISGALGGVVFVDGGNVWSEVAHFDLGEMKWGAGFGLRYMSPIGPLRAEVAWKLDRLPGESAYEFHISFGNPF